MSDGFYPHAEDDAYVTAIESALRLLSDRVEAAEARVRELEDALRRESVNQDSTYCNGGPLTCDECRGSCGIEEHWELIQSLEASSPSREETP